MLRKHLCSAGLITLLLTAPIAAKAQTQTAAAQTAAQSEQDVRKVLSAFVDIWNRNELKTSFANLFTTDADFVVLSGMYLKGRDQIVAHHLEIRAGVYGDSHLVWTPVRIKFLRPGVAVAEVATEITYGPDRPSGKDKRNTFATVVLVQEDS